MAAVNTVSSSAGLLLSRSCSTQGEGTLSPAAAHNGGAEAMLVPQTPHVLGQSNSGGSLTGATSTRVHRLDRKSGDGTSPLPTPSSTTLTQSTASPLKFVRGMKLCPQDNH